MTRPADISMQSYRSRYSHVSNTTLSNYSAMNQSHLKNKKSVEAFMTELVGDQFYQLVFLLSLENQADFEEDGRFSNRDVNRNMKLIQARERRFKENQELLLSTNGFKLNFPKNMSKFPPSMKEIYEFYKQTIRADDLIAL